MRKLFALCIALAAIGPAYADTIKSTYDFGPAFPERLAMVMLTCKTCHGARSVSINGVELERDVASAADVAVRQRIPLIAMERNLSLSEIRALMNDSNAETAEIWSALLPEGSGELPVLITSDHSLADADVGIGAMGEEPGRKIVGKFVKRTAAGLSAYSLDTEDGDVVVAVSRGGGSYAGSSAPWKAFQVGQSRIATWNIERAYPAFTVSGTSATSAVAVYR